MNARSDLELPPGTAVYCCPRGLVLELSWHSRLGMHILRQEVPLEACDPESRHDLCAIASDFRSHAAAEGFRG
jgi:hypothetical protein